MRPELRRNLQRLLAPRHVAVVGGRDAEIVAQECGRIGFRGPIWGVNPRRSEIAGHPCFGRVEDLPEPPDAVFLAVPRAAAIETVAQLRKIGAGGVVCYSAGFRELGGAGTLAEQTLAEAAGDLALVGPNCYGLINYGHRVALWPFAHGSSKVTEGAAIVTQSGMLGSDLTMSQRSTPFLYMITVGNQAVLRFEDFLEVLVEDPDVRAIGLHIEGVQDVGRFASAAIKALEANVPIVALKTGTSTVGAKLTVSHTGSLSGTDELYQALFDRLGIIRVDSPAALLETVKFLCVSGAPKGNRIAGFTCSGGGATMLADHAERIGLDFATPTPETAALLKQRLPEIATVSNPLDYTTPLWGDVERLPPVFQAMLGDRYDMAVMVQDYPLPELAGSKDSYEKDARSFMAMARAANLPAAICSTVPENMDRDSREMMLAGGIAPLQGLAEALGAMAGAARYGLRRERVMARGGLPALGLLEPIAGRNRAALVDEWQGKRVLHSAGLAVPEGRVATLDEVGDAATEVGFPVALKMVSDRIAHKSEIGAVRLGLSTAQAVAEAADEMSTTVARHDKAANSGRFLVERMLPSPVAELLVDIRRDAQFGLAMTLASGGTLVELLSDAVTLLLPAAPDDIQDALARLKLSKLLDGYRGRPSADRKALVDYIGRLARFAEAQIDRIAEIEINPLFVLPNTTCAVDVVMWSAPKDGG
ncbi:MAG: acetate--CoA ligase family protein [Dongiaceae bacterium]